ncbi:hypothetical protein LIER_42460 [Lithospermum erythrorhizon]|uniref:Uncharacterized protein n=1 Tax=Lithospermum erythrorhizon TaxID=34254 RepID=A0AAV3RVU9_LITER
MVDDDVSGTSDFPPGCGPGEDVTENSKKLKAIGQIELNANEDVSNPDSPKINMAFTPNYFEVNGQTNKKPQIMLPRDSSRGFMETINFFEFQNSAPTITTTGITATCSPNGGKLFLGGMKILYSATRSEDNRAHDSTAEVARQLSRSP